MKLPPPPPKKGLVYNTHLGRVVLLLRTYLKMAKYLNKFLKVHSVCGVINFATTFSVRNKHTCKPVYLTMYVRPSANYAPEATFTTDRTLPRSS
jgi:hypothetical protein